ncbi:MAG: flagellar biosynthetic protein FliR [Lachnospiraceae bacterium]|nr:flagellar biosynthetic protein FliR [Lachnospiraceae bacterium]
MINFSFSMNDLEYFLLILTRVSCFVFVAPFFSLNNTPRHVRVVLSIFTALLLYQTLTPAPAVEYNTIAGYSAIVLREAITGLMIGLGTSMCSAIVNFAGHIADMETGLSMVTLMDPTTRESSSITGIFYQYVVMLMLIASGMYRYLFGALADTFVLIPVNGTIFKMDSLLVSVIKFLGDYIVIGFRICLPIFCVILMLNAILGVLAKVSPQMNMFAVGIQLKIMVGLSVLLLSASMLPDAANFIFQQMKETIVAIVGGLM